MGVSSSFVSADCLMELSNRIFPPLSEDVLILREISCRCPAVKTLDCFQLAGGSKGMGELVYSFLKSLTQSWCALLQSALPLLHISSKRDTKTCFEVTLIKGWFNKAAELVLHWPTIPNIISFADMHFPE